MIFLRLSTGLSARYDDEGEEGRANVRLFIGTESVVDGELWKEGWFNCLSSAVRYAKELLFWSYGR